MKTTQMIDLAHAGTSKAPHVHAGLRVLAVAILLLAAAVVEAAPKKAATRPITGDRSGALVYTADAQGNRIPDFSFAGYGGGNDPIPTVPAKVVVPPVTGDNTARVQAAIDYVASQPADEHGFRGAVLLQKGRYEIDGGLHITTSGVVLRGVGAGEDGTILFAAGQGRRTLITIAGVDDRSASGKAINVATKYVPVGATQFELADAPNFKPGDTILVHRASTPQWIALLKMEDVGGGMGSGWKPGSRDIIWDRTVTAVDGPKVTIDAPITTALDADMGGATVSAYGWHGRISNVGVENLRCESAYDTSNPKDEAHSWFAITLDDVRDAWVRRVTFVHFAGSAVSAFDGASRITVEDCKSLAPVSEIAGYRRHTFFTSGQQVLFQRCYSEHGRHDFAVGFCAPGPNAFVQCEARGALDDSGAIDSWASGTLFDNVRMEGGGISLTDRRNKNAFAGWSAANSVLWQCSSTMFTCFDPPGARNYGFGCWGMFAGDSTFWETDNFVKPESLYYGQLAQRIGNAAADRAQLMPRDDTGETRAPKPDEAALAIAASTQPAPSMGDWVDVLAMRTLIATDASGAKSFDDAGLNRAPSEEKPKGASQRLTVTNGWLTIDGKLVAGGRQHIKWWRGGMRPNEVTESIKDGPDITRFAPGRIGPGLTDDLNQLADHMVDSGRSALDYHYGLWYDQRDVDHERTRRPDGDAWAPFFELPFARSGGDEPAWDGLSKYDLTKFNPWYWSRLKQFADICDDRGLVLMHSNFFQHNILEAGAHWASNPWRSINNVNHTGFPEPPPYAGDKIIYMAEQFYDETNAARRPLLRGYIRQCLDNFAANGNVIQFTGDEFTGPTHFVQFWLDTIAEWERDTGKHAIIGLAVPKDVQDAILADPARAAVVSVIDIRFWWYQPGGKIYAPPGGQNLSPRQWIRQQNPKFPDFAQSLRAVREYRTKFPDKAVMLGPEDGPNPPGWGVLMGGGSLPNLAGLNPKLLAAIPTMRPIDVSHASSGQYALGDDGRNYLVYVDSDAAPQLRLPAGDAKYTQHWIDPRSGRMTDSPVVVGGNGAVEFKSPGFAPYVFWLSKQ